MSWENHRLIENRIKNSDTGRHFLFWFLLHKSEKLKALNQMYNNLTERYYNSHEFSHFHNYKDHPVHPQMINTAPILDFEFIYKNQKRKEQIEALGLENGQPRNQQWLRHFAETDKHTGQ